MTLLGPRPPASTVEGVVPPSRHDPVVRAASEVAGGPAGRRIGDGRHGWWTAVRVLTLMAVVMIAMGVVQKQHCRAEGWASPDQFTHACYSDLPVGYETSGLGIGATPYVDAVAGQYLDQPVGTGIVMTAVAALVPDGDPMDQDRWYFDLGALVLAVAAAVTVIALAGAAGRRRWDAAVVAACPPLLLAGLVSFDLVAIALLAGALWCWAAERPAQAGILLGISAAVRPTPAVAVSIALVLLGVRAGRVPVVRRAVGWAGLAWSAINLPVLLMSPPGWLAAPQTWWDAGAGYGSVWLVPQLAGRALPNGAVTTLAVVGGFGVIAATAVLTLAAPRRPRLAQVAFLLVAGLLLTSKAFPVQGALWVAPLLALALPRWREVLVWGVTESAYFGGVWLYLVSQSTPDRGLPDDLYGYLLGARLLVLVWVIVQVVRGMLDPGRDPVRSRGVARAERTVAGAGGSPVRDICPGPVTPADGLTTGVDEGDGEGLFAGREDVRVLTR